MAVRGSLRIRGDLATAYEYLGRPDEAIDQETRILADALEAEDVAEIDRSLSRLGANYWSANALIAADRCCQLREALATADGGEPSGGMVLSRAAQAAVCGQAEQARELISQAESLGPPLNSPWFEDNVQSWRLYLALYADASLTQDRLSVTLATARSWSLRREVASYRFRLHVCDGELRQALVALEEHERLGRDAGLDVAPAATAYLLAKLGRTAEATAAVEEALTRLSHLHPFARRHYYLAFALRELGRRAEAVEHARLAYQRAWAEGPPYYQHWKLREARELLDALGEPVPDLPVVDPASVTIPLEDKIRAFIAAREAEQQGSGEADS